MKVLVLGASGFIGSSVADALVRGGHQVIGQTRSAERNGTSFASREIEILESDPFNDDKWTLILDSVDVVVDCIGGDQSIEIFNKVENLKRDSTASKLVYIWTSGVWLHGDDRWEIVTEGTAALHAPEKVAWRLEVENTIVQSEKVSGIIIRPGLLYGRSGSVIALLFDQAVTENKIEWPGKPGGRYATVHVDDLGELYRLVVEKHPLVKGLKIEGSNHATESVDLLLDRTAELVKIDGYSYKTPIGPFEIALSGTTVVRETFGRSLLGWQPVKPSLIDGLATYYQAYRASKSK